MTQMSKSNQDNKLSTNTDVRISRKAHLKVIFTALYMFKTSEKRLNILKQMLGKLFLKFQIKFLKIRT